MTDTNLPLRCQVGDCGNRAAVTVTIELPAQWSGSRTYNVVTLQVAACSECARDLQGHGQELLKARVRFARQMEIEAHAGHLATELVALIEAVGPPFEPVHGSVFATWLAKLDKPLAQSAWRLLAHVKRQANGGRLAGGLVDSGQRAEHGDHDQARSLSIDEARFRHAGLMPPADRGPRGGDDAA
jgi:hypothetical protein